MKLTRDEIILLACVLAALLVGAAVKHYRDLARLPHPPAAASATPAPLPPPPEERQPEPPDSPER